MSISFEERNFIDYFIEACQIDDAYTEEFFSNIESFCSSIGNLENINFGFFNFNDQSIEHWNLFINIAKCGCIKNPISHHPIFTTLNYNSCLDLNNEISQALVTFLFLVISQTDSLNNQTFIHAVSTIDYAHCIRFPKLCYIFSKLVIKRSQTEIYNYLVFLTELEDQNSINGSLMTMVHCKSEFVLTIISCDQNLSDFYINFAISIQNVWLLTAILSKVTNKDVINNHFPTLMDFYSEATSKSVPFSEHLLLCYLKNDTIVELLNEHGIIDDVVDNFLHDQYQSLDGIQKLKLFKKITIELSADFVNHLINEDTHLVADLLEHYPSDIIPILKNYIQISGNYSIFLIPDLASAIYESCQEGAILVDSLPQNILEEIN